MKYDDEFDKFLTQNLSAEQNYIDDDGFSLNVIARLPQQKTSMLREQLIVWGTALIIASIVLMQFPWRLVLQNIYAWIYTLNLISLIQIGVILLVSTMVLPLLWLRRVRI
jgi:hypothetical protein